MNKALVLLILMVALYASQVLAVEVGSDLTDSDKTTFNNILDPVMKIYNFVKYAATVLAVMFFLFSGVTFITSGNDQAKRESAKMMATYIVIGLIVIWMAPLVVNYLVG